MNAPAVEALNLSNRYGRVDALSDASFFALGNAITVLLGENGAGKTTAIKLVLGFLSPDMGWLESRVSRVGFVPDRPAFFPWLRGREILAATLRVFGSDPADLDLRAAGLSGRIGFDPALLERRVQGYSLGNQSKKLSYLQNPPLPPGLHRRRRALSSAPPGGHQAGCSRAFPGPQARGD